MKAQVNEIKITYKGGILAKDWQKLNSSFDTAHFIYENWDKDTICLLYTSDAADE